MLYDVIDLLVKLVGLEKRSPPHKNGMCNLQHPVRHFEVIWRDTADKVLEDKCLVFRAPSNLTSQSFTNLYECVPPLPEVRVCYNADCLAKLGLDVRGRQDHETNELLLDGSDLIGGQLVVSIFVLHHRICQNCPCGSLNGCRSWTIPRS